MKTKKKQQNNKKCVPTFDVKLTRAELTHLRNLFSVLLPPSGDVTLSKALAMQTMGNEIIEGRLWRKIEAACRSADVPTEDDAPDFAVTVVGSVKIDVVPVEVVSEQSTINQQNTVLDGEE